jgi:hypothetical protein
MIAFVEWLTAQTTASTIVCESNNATDLRLEISKQDAYPTTFPVEAGVSGLYRAGDAAGK